MKYQTMLKKIGEPQICAICSMGFPEELKKPMTSSHENPMQPTGDHIIPISKGGKDVGANLQWVHWICNQKKGNLYTTEEDYSKMLADALNIVAQYRELINNEQLEKKVDRWVRKVMPIVNLRKL